MNERDQLKEKLAVAESELERLKSSLNAAIDGAREQAQLAAESLNDVDQKRWALEQEVTMLRSERGALEHALSEAQVALGRKKSVSGSLDGDETSDASYDEDDDDDDDESPRAAKCEACRTALPTLKMIVKTANERAAEAEQRAQTAEQRAQTATTAAQTAAERLAEAEKRAAALEQAKQLAEQKEAAAEEQAKVECAACATLHTKVTSLEEQLQQQQQQFEQQQKESKQKEKEQKEQTTANDDKDSKDSDADTAALPTPPAIAVDAADENSANKVDDDTSLDDTPPLPSTPLVTSVSRSNLQGWFLLILDCLLFSCFLIFNFQTFFFYLIISKQIRIG